MSMILSLYARLTRALHPLVPGILQKRARIGKEDSARLGERLGQYPQKRADAPLVWIHGVSVGESLSALPVIEMIHKIRPDVRFIVSTATTTSATIVAGRLPDYAQHIYAPVDTPQAVSGFLSHWKPDLALFIESDIWPNMLQQLVQHKIPHGLISARITAKTARNWRYVKGAISTLLRGYNFIMPQDEVSAQRIHDMGVKTAQFLNLKAFGTALEVNKNKLEVLKADIGERFVIVAASTHYGEDVIMAKAAQNALKSGALLVIVPRHPIKAADIALDLESMGLYVCRRSLDDLITPKVQVYVADTLGEMGTFLALGDLIIMGGSFLGGIGGHNPLEPARLGKACLTGPDISNWEGIYNDLMLAGAATKIDGISQLELMIDQLKKNPEAIDYMNARTKNAAHKNKNTLDDLWGHIEPILRAKHGH